MPYSAQLSSLTFAVTGNCAWAALPALHTPHRVGEKKGALNILNVVSLLIHNVHVTGNCAWAALPALHFIHTPHRVGKKEGVKKALNILKVVS